MRSHWARDDVRQTRASRGARTTRTLSAQSTSGILSLGWIADRAASDAAFEGRAGRLPSGVRWESRAAVRRNLPPVGAVPGDSIWARLGIGYESTSSRFSAPGGGASIEVSTLTLPRWLGFSYAYTAVTEPGSGHVERNVTLPHSLAAVILLLPPIAWVVPRLRRRRRRLADQCVACGYDLRATPEKGGTLLGRCPECGTSRASKAGARQAAAPAGSVTP